MAAFHPKSTTLRLAQSAGVADGKVVTKSSTVSGIDVNASADVLHRTGQSLGTILEHPVTEIRRNEVSVVE